MNLKIKNKLTINLFFLLAIFSILLPSNLYANVSSRPGNSASLTHSQVNEVIGFSYEALRAVYTLDFVKLDTNLVKDSEAYFTENGFKSFQSIFAKTIDLSEVKSKKEISSIGLYDSPIIINHSSSDNVPSWQVQVPLTIILKGPTQIYTTKKALLTLWIVRSSNPKHYRGMAIDKINLESL